MHDLNTRNTRIAFRAAVCLESYSLFNPNRCGRIAAVLSPRATVPLWSCDTADTVAFGSHFPRAPQGSREPYICRGTKQAVSGPREKGLIQRWRPGDRMSLCASAVLWDVEAFQMQLKGPPGVKRLLVIITDSSHRLKACRAPTTHKLLHFTLKLLF